MRLTPVQAFNAVTLNSAYAMGISDIAGSVTPGKLANLIVTRPGWNLTRLAYNYSTPFASRIILRGKTLMQLI
jgi:imidazolonepropionase